MARLDLNGTGGLSVDDLERRPCPFDIYDKFLVPKIVGIPNRTADGQNLIEQGICLSRSAHGVFDRRKSQKGADLGILCRTDSSMMFENIDK